MNTGTPALTSRSMNEEDMKVVGAFIIECIKIALDVDKMVAEKEKPTVKAFYKSLENEDVMQKINGVRKRVEEFAVKFPMPGFDDH